MTGPGADRVCIVAGVGSGVGRALAWRLSADGAAVVLAARSGEVTIPLAREIDASGGTALALQADVSDRASCDHMAARVVDELGRIDAMVSNVGVTGPRQAIDESDLAQWRSLFDVNALGAVRLAQAVLPTMRDQGGGSIVMIGSMITQVPVNHVGRGAYAASKAALQSVMHTLAQESGRFGVRVNVVAPGWIWGPALIDGHAAERARQEHRTIDSIYEELAVRTALRRLPTPGDVADAAAFLASDQAACITGQTLSVNGGETFG